MVGTADPYYTRKPVPAELIKDVGITGLAPEEEFWNRERKYSVNGVDIRKFSNSKKSGMEPQDDPYYGRRRVSAAEIANVGPTGLTPEQEHWNRERKYSVNGVDVRRFSTSRKGGMEPLDDPYYGRKQVSKSEIVGIGDTGMTPAEQYEVRERKQSLFQLSDDPFDTIAGRHRQSVSGVASGASNAATRRRSSAVAPDAHEAMASHSGYNNDKFDKLAPIESRPEIPPVNFGENTFGESSSRKTSETLHRDTAPTSGTLGNASSSAAGASGSHTAGTGSGTRGGAGQHTQYHDAVTTGHDHNQRQVTEPDSVASRHEPNINGGGAVEPRQQQQRFDDPDSVAPDEVR